MSNPIKLVADCWDINGFFKRGEFFIISFFWLVLLFILSIVYSKNYIPNDLSLTLIAYIMIFVLMLFAGAVVRRLNYMGLMQRYVWIMALPVFGIIFYLYLIVSKNDDGCWGESGDDILPYSKVVFDIATVVGFVRVIGIIIFTLWLPNYYMVLDVFLSFDILIVFFVIIYLINIIFEELGVDPLTTLKLCFDWSGKFVRKEYLSMPFISGVVIIIWMFIFFFFSVVDDNPILNTLESIMLIGVLVAGIGAHIRRLNDLMLPRRYTYIFFIPLAALPLIIYLFSAKTRRIPIDQKSSTAIVLNILSYFGGGFFVIYMIFVLIGKFTNYGAPP